MGTTASGCQCEKSMKKRKFEIILAQLKEMATVYKGIKSQGVENNFKKWVNCGYG